MWPLIKKELKVHIASPIAAVTFSLFLFLTGFAFTTQMTQPSLQHLPEASLRGMVYFMAVIFLFLAPLLTMKTFAEEKKIGTIELLKTSPLSDPSIVMGKFFSVLVLYTLLLLMTMEYPAFISFSGEPDPGPMILSYVGLFLMGAAFLAAGIFCSVVTQSQMIAAVLTFVLLLTLWFFGEAGEGIGEKISVSRHLESFSLGVLDLGDVAYYLLFAVLFLFLATRYLAGKSWINTVIFASIVIASSAFLYRFLERSPVRWDATANRDFTLSEQTDSTLKTLKEEVKVFAFFRRGDDPDSLFIRRKVDDVLREYAKRSSRIAYRLVNPDSEIEQATQYNITTDGTIVFLSGRNRKDIYQSQLFDYSRMSEATLPEFVGEGLFTNALLKVIQEKSSRIYFLEGHGERGLGDPSPVGYSQTRDYLLKNNYEVRGLNLVEARKIPTDCDLLIVAGPGKQIPSSEDRLINDYLRQGHGGLLVLGEPQPLSLLGETLDTVGIRWNRGLVLDPERHFLLGSHYPSPVMETHEITKGLQDINPIFSTVRSLQIDEKKGRSSARLLRTSNAARDETQRAGPLTIGAISVSESDSMRGKAIVIGDSDFASNALIQAPGNLDLFLNMVGWLIGEKEQVTIRPKTPEFRTLTMTPFRARLIAYFSQLCYPLLILSLGGGYWLKRRRQ